MPRPLTLRRAFAISIAIVLAQIVAAAAFSGGRSVRGAYLKLLNWDSAHYQRIATVGYRLPSHRPITSWDIHAGFANVVFFPAYPMIARLVHHSTGLSIEVSLLLVAQLAAIVFWMYFLLIVAGLGISEQGLAAAVVAVLAYPSTFFLITGYTESLFLAAALGFIYWCDRWFDQGSRKAWLVALLHGWAFSATRIVGFAVAGYAAFRDLVKKRVRAASLVLLGLSVAASIAFFAYCQWKFGDWAIYFKLQVIGWNNHQLYFAILNPLSYIPHFFFEDTVDSFSRSSVTLSGFLFVSWAMVEWRLYRAVGRFSETRIARASAAFLMFYIALTGKADANMDSMIRYTLPVYVLLVINFCELNRIRLERGEPELFFSGPRRPWKLAIALILGFGIQCWNMYRFTHGHWVA